MVVNLVGGLVVQSNITTICLLPQHRIPVPWGTHACDQMDRGMIGQPRERERERERVRERGEREREDTHTHTHTER